MPTGVALRDARSQLFAAARLILVRGGPGALTSRAVTEEVGVAKGVLHRYFPDFDSFLVELVLDRLAGVRAEGVRLQGRVGQDTVVGNVAAALPVMLDPVALRMVSLVSSRDAVRQRLRSFTPTGVPVLAEVTGVLAHYLGAERDDGRLVPSAEVDTLALTLVGAGHLLLAGDLGARPGRDAVEEVVASVLAGVEAVEQG